MAHLRWPWARRRRAAADDAEVARILGGIPTGGRHSQDPEIHREAWSRYDTRPICRDELQRLLDGGGRRCDV